MPIGGGEALISPVPYDTYGRQGELSYVRRRSPHVRTFV
ncbi:hypothetical protein BV133_3452 [Blastochloris viridis]|uniref:Uncharacterized protein n=1 Tax=Blastochloris viridis TaxID=1079 RepID=A0A182D6L2_BLAVI|nr:hypothetical protein BV133_3452 [Blastochloris viridis]